MRRDDLRPYQVLARLWLVAAAAALALPPGARLGLWLPLHLVAAGALSTAIAGNMQSFAGALTAGPPPPRLLVRAQLALLTAGVASVAAGYPTQSRPLVAGGGGAFVASVALVGAAVWRAWRRGLNRRHRLSLAYYAAAICAVLVGGALGAVVGSGAVTGRTWVALRQAHMVLNVLGWVSLTIAGTLVTFLPTVLRVRMPPWPARPAAALLVAGVGALAAGLALGDGPLAAGGGMAEAGGATLLGWMALRSWQIPRRHRAPVSAKHLTAAVAWFVGGAWALGAAMLRAAVDGDLEASFAAFRQVFLVAFVAGWAVQTLLGAWLHLLPAARGGDPDQRRLALAAVEHGAGAQLLALNGGLVLVLGPAPQLGAALALAGGLVALGKTWLYPRLVSLPSTRRRAARQWG